MWTKEISKRAKPQKQKMNKAKESIGSQYWSTCWARLWLEDTVVQTHTAELGPEPRPFHAEFNLPLSGTPSSSLFKTRSCCAAQADI